MDVDSFIKRSRQRDDGTEDGAMKRGRFEDDDEDGDAGAASSSRMPTVEEVVDQMDEVDAPTLDEPGLKKLVLRLERIITKNQQLRVKYPDQPDKFIESEADLDEELKRFHAVATVPHLYGVLVSLSVVQSLVGLLAHDNHDIAIDVVELLKEMTDEDNTAGAEKAITVFLDDLIKHHLPEMLVSNMLRLNESVPEDSQGVFSSLAVIENLIEIRLSMADLFVSKTQLLTWLLKRLTARAFDANKQYCSEILSILLQHSKENRLALGKQDGIDALLECLNMYKRKDPQGGADEVELLENLFDALCSALMEKENKDLFREAEGFELMVIMIKEKMLARKGAIKALSYALTGVEAAANANHFIEVLGLGTLFAAFMQKGAKKLRKAYKDHYDEAAEEEHCVSSIASLLQFATGEHRARLLEKFAEEEREKLQRLVELHLKFTARMEATGRAIAADRRARIASGDVITEEDEEDFFARRLEGGLFTLQQVDLALAFVVTERDDLREHAAQLMRVKGGRWSDVVDVLGEYAGVIGETASHEERERQRAQLREMVQQVQQAYSAS